MTDIDSARRAERLATIHRAERALIKGLLIALFGAILFVLFMLCIARNAAQASECRFTNRGRVICPGHARHFHRYHHVARHHHRRYHVATGGLVTVETAAHIRITVAAEFAPKILPFIAALVREGYHPHQIHCYAQRGHVRHSLHYQGRACDFDQRDWGITAKPMYYVSRLTRQFGLRDGAEFCDWGHIDDGADLGHDCTARYLHNVPLYGAVAFYHRRHHVADGIRIARAHHYRRRRSTFRLAAYRAPRDVAAVAPYPFSHHHRRSHTYRLRNVAGIL